MAMWRSANGIIMSAGRNGRIAPTHIFQLIGILPNDKCTYNRVKHAWINPLYMWDNAQKYMNSDRSLDELHEFRNDASSLKDWSEVSRTHAHPGGRVLYGIYDARRAPSGDTCKGIRRIMDSGPECGRD
eukprot:7641517-Pyramimonas_sp.AAC.1